MPQNPQGNGMNFNGPNMYVQPFPNFPQNGRNNNMNNNMKNINPNIMNNGIMSY